MNPKRQLSRDELEIHLKEQIAFLEASANLFDAGSEAEAKRLAATIRTLVHDTTASHALLEQLKLLKNLEFFDTSFDLDPQNKMTHHGLVFIAIGPRQTRYVAMLDDLPPNITVKKVDFDIWWNKPVFVDNQGRVLTRKKLILTAANQDGGAHVDPSLDERYASLSQNGSLGWVADDSTGENIIESPERAAIRQIAHEVLKTLKPDYNKKSQHPYPDEVIFGGSELREVKGEQNDKETLTERKIKIGRNEPCPCGSGLKYKNCCDRKE